MDQLHQYIQKARQLGKSDDQIRQALIAGGWTREQIEPAFLVLPTSQQPEPLPTPAITQQPVLIGQPGSSNNSTAQKPYTPVRNTRPSQPVNLGIQSTKSWKKTLLLLGIGLVLLLIIGGSFKLLGPKDTYQSVTQKFVLAVQNDNKKEADALESPAFKSYTQQNAGTNSFYDFCKHSGQLCEPFFASSYLDKTTTTYKAYEASNGVQGEEVIYAKKQPTGGANCSGNASLLTIAAVPSGNTWLIDYVNPFLSFNATSC